MKKSDFKPIEYDNIDIIKGYTDKKCYSSCDYTLGCLYMWRDTYNTQYCEEDGVLYIKNDMVSNGEKKEAFFFPLRSDGTPATKKDVDRLVDYAKNNNEILSFSPIEREMLDLLILYYKDSAQYKLERNYSDYIYTADDLRYLKGKKYNGQRNHINKFERMYTRYSFENITAENKQQIYTFMNTLEAKSKTRASIGEMENVYDVVDNIELLFQESAVLKVDGDIAAFTVGEVVGDFLFSHIEKADRDYAGCYAVINRYFIDYVNAKYGEKIKLVNREDDAGDEGLRVAKLAYHPYIILEKYSCDIKSDIKE